MTPMARRVSDAEQDWFVLVACFGECRVAPGIPIDRIMCVLKQVRTRLVDQCVRVFVLAHRFSNLRIASL